MTIELNSDQKKRLEELARQAGKSPEALASELLDEALGTRERGNGSRPEEPEDALVRKQRQAHENFIKEMDALPLEGPDDGFSGTDHDKVLYGSKP